MKSYLNILESVIQDGFEKSPTRGNSLVGGGVTTLSLPNVFFSHYMQDGFPLLTTKKMSLRNIATELEFFTRGLTDKRWLQDRGCHIWDGWCCPTNVDSDYVGNADYAKENPDLGPLGYSWQFRRFGEPYKRIPFLFGVTPNIEDVGYSETMENSPTFDFWKELLHNVYHGDLKDTPYYVCNRWLRFENFKVDFIFGGLTHEGFCFCPSEHPFIDGEHQDTPRGFDQLADICDKIANHPGDRRIGATFVNPNEAKHMALPPCHLGFRIVIHDELMSLNFTMRSTDLFLGLPYNIASYGLLLSILSKQFGYQPYKLSCMMTDAHIYDNHLAQAMEQIKRKPYDLPTLDLSSDISIENWSYDKDVKLTGYHSHKPIKGEVTI